MRWTVIMAATAVLWAGAAAADEYRVAAGNIWTGVKLYFGPQKMYVGEVLGGNEAYIDPTTRQQFRAIKIRMGSGSEEWKDREAIAIGDWYVRRDDPALSAWEWEILAR